MLASTHAHVAWNEPGAPVPGTALPVGAVLDDTLFVIAGDIPELRIRVLDRGGTLVRQVCREAPPMPFTAAESSLAKSLGESQPLERAARIGRLFTGTDGRIWVQRNREGGHLLADKHFGPPGATFDVFESGGAYLGEVVAPRDVRLVAARGDTIIGFRYGDDRVSVVAYGISHGK